MDKRKQKGRTCLLCTHGRVERGKRRCAFSTPDEVVGKFEGRTCAEWDVVKYPVQWMEGGDPVTGLTQRPIRGTRFPERVM